MYISPGEHVTSQDLAHLIAQLPEPIIFCVDFNVKHVLWGNTAVDAGVAAVERFLLQSPLTVLNHFHSPTVSSSAIDLSPLCLLISLLVLHGKSATTFMAAITGRLLSGRYTLQQPHVKPGTCCQGRLSTF